MFQTTNQGRSPGSENTAMVSWNRDLMEYIINFVVSMGDLLDPIDGLVRDCTIYAAGHSLEVSPQKHRRETSA